MVNELGYEGIEFPVSRKDFCKIEKKNKIYINVFCYENNLVYPVHISKQKYKDYMDLFLIDDENKSHMDLFLINDEKKPHYVCIKILTDLHLIRQNIKIKNTFADIICSVSVVKWFW